MAAARRVSTRERDNRHAPITMNTVSTSGNSSGSSDMPSAMAPSKASSHEPRSHQYSTNASTLSTSPMAPNAMTSRRVSPLQARLFLREPRERLADGADGAVGSGGEDDGETRAAQHQRSGKNLRDIFAAGRSQAIGHLDRGALAHREGFTGQQRFIDLDVIAGHQDPVCGDTIALGDHDDVAAHHFPARNADSLAVANHQRAWAGELAQRIECLFTAPLLDDGDGHGDGREGEQHQCVAAFAQYSVDHRRRNQQREHRLADDFTDDLGAGPLS